jgi:uncharacterized oligopeptide transporter (OPT) family protein
VAWVIPEVHGYAYAMTLGALLAYFIQKHRSTVWNIYGFPVASGLVSGEACSGLILAALVMAGVNPDTVGTQIGVGWEQ